jgi:hypothetical protein
MATEKSTDPQVVPPTVFGCFFLMFAAVGCMAVIGLVWLYNEWNFASRAQPVVGTVVVEEIKQGHGPLHLWDWKAAVRYDYLGSEHAGTVSTGLFGGYSSGKPIDLLVSPDKPGALYAPAFDDDWGFRLNGMAGKVASWGLPPHWPKEDAESVRVNSCWDRFVVPTLWTLFWIAGTALVIYLFYSLAKRSFARRRSRACVREREGEDQWKKWQVS